jgi:hypothetical protein
VLDIEELLLDGRLVIFSTSLSLFQGCLMGLRSGNAEVVSKHAVSLWKTSFRGALNCVLAHYIVGMSIRRFVSRMGGHNLLRYINVENVNLRGYK